MAVSVFSTYLPAESGPLVVLAAAALFGFIIFPCVGVWALFGSRLRRFLLVPRWRRAAQSLHASSTTAPAAG